MRESLASSACGLTWWHSGLGAQRGLLWEIRQRSFEEDLFPPVDSDEKTQSVVLKHLLAWWRVVMSETVPHFLRVSLRLNTFYREEYLGRGA